MQTSIDEQAKEPEAQPEDPEIRELSDRRDFLRSLGKWSTAAISAMLLTDATPSSQASGWLKTRGVGDGSWVNRRGC